ncbi:unnamed protein product [Prunus armeniaca]|uniref:Uncharacterized protein n=1 Tax=Prunus armeniaca TaxID=36596 RepID=A0A6J5UVZ4_PRUAR|nr:unnamed protein product [Prunus armeniaca]
MTLSLGFCLLLSPQFNNSLRKFSPSSIRNGQTLKVRTAPEALHLYTNVMRNASALTTHVASQLMGSTNLLPETVKHFIKLSPYKPFRTYVFCTGNGKLVVLENPEAVLQTLFYSCQLSSETEWAAISHKCLDMQNVVEVDKLEELCLGSDGYLDDLGLSVRARLCLRAA